MKIVMKFGGSSLANANRIKSVARIVHGYASEHRIVVVASAMDDVTDRLVELAELATKGESQKASAIVAKLKHLHIKAAAVASAGSHKDLIDTISSLNSELTKTVEGVTHLREMTDRSRDYLLSFGERLSAPILSFALKAQELKSRSLTGGEAGITTDDHFGEARPLIETSYQQLRKRIEPLLLKREIPVVTGFIATSLEGNITTLGRGGSDYTASLIGAAIEADEIWIWTDVDGLMTADPRIVRDAKILSHVSFGEALELSYFGAKMMHPRALFPASQRKIPVRVRNSKRPEFEGTLVSTKESNDDGHVAKAITMISDVGIVTVSGAGMIGAPGTAAKVFQTLGSSEINIIMISQGSSEAAISCVVARRDIDKAVRALQLALLGQGYVEKITAEKDSCVIAAVGAGMKGTPGIAARIFGAVANKKINVRMVAQGSSEYNVSFVVAEHDGPTAVRAIHEELQLAQTGLS